MNKVSVLFGSLLVVMAVLCSCSLYNQGGVKKEQATTYVPIEEIKVEQDTATSAEVDPKSKDAIVLIVNETELVKIEPKAYDPDKDKLEFAYSFPLDQNGKWQTTYGDQGEYTVTVTATDGEFSVSKDILIIVNKKEEAPEILSISPKDKVIIYKETDEIGFGVNASDLNNDPLAYRWKLDGKNVSEGSTFRYKTTYDDAGSHTVKVSVSDGVLENDFLWSVTVENVNRKPIIEKIDDVTVRETETVTLSVLASDPDDDTLSITIGDPVGDDGTWETTYDDAGVYTVKITASDGVDEVSEEVKVTVGNVNRPPVIVGISSG